VKDYRLGPLYTPPVVSKADGPVATLMMGAANGGTNWPGGFLQSRKPYRLCLCLQFLSVGHRPGDAAAGHDDLAFVEGRVGQRVVMVNAAAPTRAPMRR